MFSLNFVPRSNVHIEPVGLVIPLIVLSLVRGLPTCTVLPLPAVSALPSLECPRPSVVGVIPLSPATDPCRSRVG